MTRVPLPRGSLSILQSRSPPRLHINYSQVNRINRIHNNIGNMSICSSDSCTREAIIEGGKCIIHSIEKERCFAKQCVEFAIKDGKCRVHMNINFCSFIGSDSKRCNELALKTSGGKCKFHSIVRCIVEGCTREVSSKGGVGVDKCQLHVIDYCSSLDCVQIAVGNGKCVQCIQSASTVSAVSSLKVAVCSFPDCDKVTFKGGKLCKVHSYLHCSFPGCTLDVVKGNDKCNSHLICVAIHDLDIEEPDSYRSENNSSNINSNSGPKSPEPPTPIDDGPEVFRCPVTNCGRVIGETDGKCRFHSVNCSVTGCSTHQFKNGLCHYHYTRRCQMPECKQVAINNGYCEFHGLAKCSELISSAEANIRCNQSVIFGGKCKDHFIAKCNEAGCDREAQKNWDGKCLEHTNSSCNIAGCGKERLKASLSDNGSRRCEYHQNTLCSISGCNSDDQLTQIDGKNRCRIHSKSQCNVLGCYSEIFEDCKCKAHFLPSEFNLCHIFECHKEAFSCRKCKPHLNTLCNVFECDQKKKQGGNRCPAHFKRLCRFETINNACCKNTVNSTIYCADHDMRQKCVHVGCSELASRDSLLCNEHIVLSLVKPEKSKSDPKAEAGQGKNKPEGKTKLEKTKVKKGEKLEKKLKQKPLLHVFITTAIIILIALLSDRKNIVPLSVVAVALSVLIFVSL